MITNFNHWKTLNESEAKEEQIKKEWLPDILYHVSPIKNKSSILNNGIELKTGGNTYLNRTYDPRIYLATSLIAAYDIQSNFSSHTDLDYIIFEIDTKTFNGKFYEDSKFAHGVWTDTSISKSSIIKTIDPTTLHYNEDDLDALYNSTWMDYEENK